MSVSRPTTPLRRVSRGSISALSSSRGAASTPLSFLEGALGNLSDETSTLSTNLQELASIHDALNTFNEGFGMFLYGLKAAAYCIEWSEAPQEDNFNRAREQTARVRQVPRTSGIPRPSSRQGRTGAVNDAGYSVSAASHAADQTYVTVDDEASFEKVHRPPPSAVRKPPLKSAMKKPSTAAADTTKPTTTSQSGKPAQSVTKPSAAGVSKPKITLAQKKKREKYAEEVVELLPLEYRGADPAANRLAKGVVMALIASAPQGARIAEIVKPPDLPQAKVNKCLIALISAKQVVKTSNNGIVYSLDPARHSQLP